MKQEDISAGQLVSVLDQYLFGWEYKAIEQASVQGDAKLAGFILGACFIDAMAGFYAGLTKEEIKNGSKRRFVEFVERYLSQYDAVKLYEDLRCGLVHSFASGDSYVFTDANKAGFHFERTKHDRILLNLEDFLGDLRGAYAALRNDIREGGDIYQKSKRRYLSISLMGLVDISNA